MQKRTSIMICALALAVTASADVRNIRPPTTGEGKLGTTSYKWGEIHAEDGYYSNLILGGLNITNKFLSPYDGAAGEVFYANGLGGGLWGAASSPSNGISKAVADVTYASIGQGARADSAFLRDGSEPMLGDLDLDGYDIVDAGIVTAGRLKTAKANSLYTEIMSLTPETDSKIGYYGSYDYVGSDGGVGFYAVSSSGTNKFELGYLSTNNYINIQSPVISATSNVIEKVTGFGTCTSDNYPVAGLLAGDRYITFAKTGTLSRTNAVDYSRFGAVIAEVTPTLANVSQVSMNITIMYNTAGGYRRNDIVNVYANWTAGLTSMYDFVDTTMLRSDYGIGRNIKLKNKENKLILFNGYFANSIDVYALRVDRVNISTISTQTCVSVTTN